MTPVLAQVLVLSLACGPSFEPDAPFTTRAFESGWGGSWHGMSMLAATNADTVEVGDEMRFELFFRFNPFESNGQIKVWDAEEEQYWLTFTEIRGTGKYQRYPYRTGMEGVCGPRDLVDLTYGPVGSRSELFILLSSEGQQIPAGDYLVEVGYQSHGTRLRRMRSKQRGETWEYPYPPEEVWSGALYTPTFVVHVNAKLADTTRCDLPTRVDIEPYEDGQLLWRWAPDSFEPSILISRSGYHIGCRTRVTKYIGDERITPDERVLADSAAAVAFWQVYGCEGESLGGLPETDRGASFLTGPRIREALAGGKRLRAEIDVTIFETSEPPGHMWSPEAGDYRVIREYQVAQSWP